MFWGALFLFVAPVFAGTQLPDQMIGDFKLDSSEGFTDFMYELGVDWFKRSIACTIYPTLSIREGVTGRVREEDDEEDDLIAMDTVSTFKSTYTKFKLGEPWEEYTLDGRYTTTTTTVDGLRLIKVQVPEESTGYKTTHEVREFSEDGKTMTLTLTIDGVEEIKSTRVYKRVEDVDEDEQ